MSNWIEALPELEGQLSKDRPLADLCWLRVGGAAQVLFQPAHMDDISTLMKALPKDVPVLPIGVCSNLIVRDGGVDGVVIRPGSAFGGFEVLQDGTVRVGAGLLDAMTANKASQAGKDLSFLRTIPGSLGGAVKMNAGCYGRYMADVFVRATAVDRDGNVVTLTKDDMNFGYRASAVPDDMVIVQAVLNPPEGETAKIAEVMKANMAMRLESQPVGKLSAGSTFRNPSGASATGAPNEDHAQSAWKVIDQAGCRGETVGGAQMSETHANFMINADGATATDLENLGELVRKKVYENSGISLEWEIRRVGKPAP